MRRVRTTKKLAQRIDLQYFTRPHPFRRWRLWLSALVPAAAIAWLAAQRATGLKLYSSGPLSVSHAVFAKRCELCHNLSRGSFRAEVNDGTCLQCHDAPAHHADQATFSPTCASCHREHKGAVRLANTRDETCTQCHGDLQIRNGRTQYVASVKSFAKQHPEFVPLRPGGADPGKIKFNHYAHLQPNLAGPHGAVQLDCSDCHRLSAQGVWPYAMPTSEMASPAVNPTRDMGDIRRSRAETYMAPVRYAKQCAGCHTHDLQFDKRFNEPVPHDRPEVVEAFLRQKYSDYFSSHPTALSEPVALEQSIVAPGRTVPPTPRTSQQWIDLNVMFAERLLFGKGCKVCHTMIEGNGPLPTVARSSIPLRWLPHAVFNHNSHRLLTCIACHNRAPESRASSDILLPGIASCRGCHTARGPQQDTANGLCSECHVYHDWKQEKPTNGRYTIPQLRAGL